MVMKITLLTVFPSSFESFLSYPVIRRAMKNGLVEMEVVDIREYTEGSFRAIDDSPYGGGRGLLLKVDTLMNALNKVKTPSSRTVLLGPKGKTFNQRTALKYSKEDHLILVSGHFEGVDERFRAYIDEEVSIGDYILTGGESAAVVIAEAVVRLLDGALRERSAEIESFEDNLLEYPQYTHPEVYEGMEVPKVLLSGDREKTELFQEEQSIRETVSLRPDLLPESREFRNFTLHKDYGEEEKILLWLKDALPVPEIRYRTDDYLILTKLKGKRLKDASKNRILRTVSSVLKRLWSLDISSCPAMKDNRTIINELKERKLSYNEWKELEKLAGMEIKESLVFSHGNLTLDNIMANGSGLTGLQGFEKSGIADRCRDLASITRSLEEVDVDPEELLEMLGIEVDEGKLEYYRRLNALY